MENEEISFGAFRLDLGRRELRRDGAPVPIHPRALGILCALAEAKGEIVSRDELMAGPWPGRIVEEGNLHVHVSALRKALDAIYFDLTKRWRTPVAESLSATFHPVGRSLTSPKQSSGNENGRSTSEGKGTLARTRKNGN